MRRPVLLFTSSAHLAPASVDALWTLPLPGHDAPGGERCADCGRLTGRVDRLCAFCEDAWLGWPL